MGFSGPQGSGGGSGTVGGGDITDGDDIAVAYVPTNYAAGTGVLGTGGHLAGIDAALAAASGTPNLAAVLAMGYLPAAPAQEFGDPTHDFAFHGRSMTVPAAVDFTFALGAGKVTKFGIGGVGASLLSSAGKLTARNYANSADAIIAASSFEGPATALAAGATIGAGVVGSTGTFTTLTLDGLTSTGNLTLALGAASAVKIGIAGVGASLASSTGALEVKNYANSSPGYLYSLGAIAWNGTTAGAFQTINGVEISDTGYFAWSREASAFQVIDLALYRLAAASLRQGGAPSASPVAQTFTLGEASRPTIDTNVAGASGTIRPGLGSGSATPSTLKVDVPIAVASGSTTQTYQTSLEVLTAGFVKLYLTASTGSGLRGNAGFLQARNFADTEYAPVWGLDFVSRTNAGSMLAVFGNTYNGLGLVSGAVVAFSSSTTDATATKDLFASRSAAGVFNLGTSAAGNSLGTLAAAGITSVGNLTLALGAASRVLVGIAGVGASLIPVADSIKVRNYADSAWGTIQALRFQTGQLDGSDGLRGLYADKDQIRIQTLSGLVWSTSSDAAASNGSGIYQLAAASLRQGLAPSASPVAQTFTLGEASRPGTDTNVAGASGTIRPGLGTGTGPAPVIRIDGVVLAASGSGVQSYVRSLDVLPSGVLRLYATGSTGATLVPASEIVTILGFNGSSPGILKVGTFITPSDDIAIYSGGVEMKSTAFYTYSSTSTYSGAKDLSRYRVAAGVEGIGTGAASGAGSAWLAGTAGERRLATAPTDSTATLTNLTALTETLIAGRIYTGTMQICVNNALAADGLQIDFNGGTVTMTSVQFGFSSALGATLGTRTSTALVTPITLSALADTSDVVIDVFFTCVVNAGGTLIPRFAKAANFAGATLTVRIGGFLHLKDVIA